MTAIRCAAALACALLASTASAQDLLTAGGRAFGAVAWFGQDLGPAQQVSEDSVFGGGRFSVGWVAWTNTTTVFDGRTGQGASFPGYLLAADKARPPTPTERNTTRNSRPARVRRFIGRSG